jgi:hypothetical protein
VSGNRKARVRSWLVTIDTVTVVRAANLRGLTWHGRVSARDATEARELVIQELARAGLSVPYGVQLVCRAIDSLPQIPESTHE